MSDHMRAQLGPAEDVIPVRVRVDHRAWARRVLYPKCIQEHPGMVRDDPASSMSVFRSPTTAHSDGRSGGPGGIQ